MLMHQLLLDGAERHADKLAFRWVDRDRSVTYAEAVAGMERMAGALAHLGVARGDRVTVFAHNGLDYLLAMLGAWRLGAISSLVNVRLAAELDYYLADHEPRVVVYTHDMHAPLRAAAGKVASIRHLVCMDGPQEGARSLPELMAAGLKPPADPWDENAIAHLSYTSGTTGKPKGACLAHEPTVRACRCIAERLRIAPEDVSFGPTALSSSYQLVGNLLPPLSAGASIQVMGRWTQVTGWEALDACGATMLVGNPPLLEEVLTESAARGRKPGWLRFVLSGGGPVPPTLKTAWRDQLAVPLVESYGQSELGGFVALGMPELPAREAEVAADGRPLPDKEVRIFGAGDRPLPLGEVGEIVIRGGFMAGYWGKPDKTAEATRGGWLHTGDLGMMDENGLVHMRSRRSELLLVGGIEWYPRDVEEALCRQPGVRQAALVGVPGKVNGLRPVAFVTGTPDGPQALIAAIADELPYDLSLLTIETLAELPMTPTGKIAKADLARAAAEKGS